MNDYTYITTLNRVASQITLKQVPWATLVVQSHEAAAYREAYPDNRVLSLPQEIKTLGPTRKYMLDQVSWKHDGKIILLDDDLSFAYRNVEGDYHIKVATPEQVEHMFSEVELALEKFCHVSVSGREGQNRLPDEPVNNCRYMRFLAYNTCLFPPGIHVGRVDGMSDFDLNLQLLRAGKPSLMFTKWAQGHKGTQTPGGCSEQRSLESHAAEVDFMVEHHSPFVKSYFKDDKGAGEFGKRKEVRVQWKKAFASA